MVFPCDFPMTSPSFSIGLNVFRVSVDYDVPVGWRWLSYDFPMVSRWSADRFRMHFQRYSPGFPWLSDCVPMVSHSVHINFQWLSYGFHLVSGGCGRPSSLAHYINLF